MIRKAILVFVFLAGIFSVSILLVVKANRALDRTIAAVMENEDDTATGKATATHSYADIALSKK
jgi:hypothetical protein